MTGSALERASTGARALLVSGVEGVRFGATRVRKVLPTVTREPLRQAPTTRQLAVSYGMSMLSAALLLLVVSVTLVSQLQHFTSQAALYDQIRVELAEGSIPIGQTDPHGLLVQPGAPLAIIEIPSLGLREVVVEGTASGQTKTGVGHRRDTPLPGQPGNAVLMGRAAAYGGPFGQLGTLSPGTKIIVTTGQGIARYSVLGVRTPQTKLPVLSGTQSRLTLTTASGLPFVPSGVLRVDAELTSRAFEKPPVALAPGLIDPSEVALGSDASGAFALSWMLELLLIMVVGSTWIWNRMPRRIAWMLIVPPVACTALAVAGAITSLLPNLL